MGLHHRDWGAMPDLTGWTVAKIFGRFASLFILSLVMGVVFGLLSSLLLKRFNASSTPTGMRHKGPDTLQGLLLQSALHVDALQNCNQVDSSKLQASTCCMHVRAQVGLLSIGSLLITGGWA